MDKTNKCAGGWGTFSNTLECVLGRRHPLSTCYFSFREIWMGEWTLGPSSLCSEKIAGRCTSIFFLVWKQFSCPCRLWSSSYPCCFTPLLLRWGNWASSLPFWSALILPCHFARRCSQLSGALAQQPLRALVLCWPHCVTLLTILALQALQEALLSSVHWVPTAYAANSIVLLVMIIHRLLQQRKPPCKLGGFSRHSGLVTRKTAEC